MPRGKKNVEARAKCREYLLRAGDLPGAMALAKRDGFGANTSIWLSALSEILGGLHKREEKCNRANQH